MPLLFTCPICGEYLVHQYHIPGLSCRLCQKHLAKNDIVQLSKRGLQACQNSWSYQNFNENTRFCVANVLPTTIELHNCHFHFVEGLTLPPNHWYSWAWEKEKVLRQYEDLGGVAHDDVTKTTEITDLYNTAIKNLDDNLIPIAHPAIQKNYSNVGIQWNDEDRAAFMKHFRENYGKIK